MSDMNKLVVKTALKDMFIKGWVSISTIKECLKLMGITPTGNTLDQLSILHCVHFKDMDRELAAAIPEMVMSLFDGVELSVDDIFKRLPAAQIIEINPEPQKKKSMLQLLGIS